MIGVDFASDRQTISGFGVSSAWTAQNLDDTLAETLFSAESGVGLSFLRVRISPEGETWETQTALKAQAHGARVWAAPWSPPGEWKSNGRDTHGGSLLPEHYPAWAERLAQFVSDIEAQGVSLYALSAQNEPDYQASWETCIFTPAELTTFVGEHLGPALAARGLDTRLMAPEASGWNRIAPFSEALLGDPAARDAIAIVATHAYNGVPFRFTMPAAHGKELWLTEASEDISGDADPGMGSALWLARMMHDDLTIADVNAWHYWWIHSGRDEPSGELRNDGLLHDGMVTRRAYVMGNFSRFVRPGHVRIATSAKTGEGAFASAFRSADGTSLVIVAVNADSSPVQQRFELSGATAGELTPWVTSDSAVLEPQPPFTAGKSFVYELQPRSVTTLVGAVTAD